MESRKHFQRIWKELSEREGFLEQSPEKIFYSGAAVTLATISQSQPHDIPELLRLLWALTDDLEKVTK